MFREARGCLGTLNRKSVSPTSRVPPQFWECQVLTASFNTSRTNAVHGSWLEVNENRAVHVAVAGGLVAVHVDALQLKVRVIMVRASDHDTLGEGLRQVPGARPFPPSRAPELPCPERGQHPTRRTSSRHIPYSTCSIRQSRRKQPPSERGRFETSRLFSASYWRTHPHCCGSRARHCKRTVAAVAAAAAAVVAVGKWKTTCKVLLSVLSVFPCSRFSLLSHCALSCLAHFLRGSSGCSPQSSTVSRRPQVWSVVDSDPPCVVPPCHVSVRHVALFEQ